MAVASISLATAALALLCGLSALSYVPQTYSFKYTVDEVFPSRKVGEAEGEM